MIRIAYAFLTISSVSVTLSVAQAAVGNPKKTQSYVGGPAAQTNPVVPRQRGGITKTGQSGSRPSKR